MNYNSGSLIVLLGSVVKTRLKLMKERGPAYSTSNATARHITIFDTSLLESKKMELMFIFLLKERGHNALW